MVTPLAAAVVSVKSAGTRDVVRRGMHSLSGREWVRRTVRGRRVSVEDAHRELHGAHQSPLVEVDLGSEQSKPLLPLTTSRSRLERPYGTVSRIRAK
jgi:hypothetical protein